MDKFQPLYLFKNRDKLCRSILVSDTILGILESRDILLDSDIAHLRSSKLLGSETLAHELLRIMAVREEGYNHLVDVLTRDEQFETVFLLTDGLHEDFKPFEELLSQEEKENATNIGGGASPMDTGGDGGSSDSANLLSSLISDFQKWRAPFGHALGLLALGSPPATDDLKRGVIPAPQAYPVPNSEAWYYYNHDSVIARRPSADIFPGYWGNNKNFKVAVKLVYKNASTVSIPDLTTAKDIKSTGNARTHHVVPVLAFTEIQDAIFIVMELATIDLGGALKVNFQNLSSDKNKLIGLLEHVVQGLHWLHQDKDRVHGNLKPQNVLLFQYKGDLVAKLSDFGLSRKIPDKTGVYSYGKDCDLWMPPERLHALQSQTEILATKKMDIWSLGLLSYHCLSNGKHPFGDHDDKLTRIKDLKITASHLETTHFRIPAADNLVQWMLQKEEERRPDISNVRNHPMFWNAEKCLSFLETVSRCLNQSGSECRQIRENVDEIYGNYFKEKYGEDFEWKGLMDERLLEAPGGKDYDSESVTSLVELISDKAEGYQDIMEVDDGAGEDAKRRKEYAENLLPLFPDLVVSLFSLLTRASGFYKCLGNLKEVYFGGYLEEEEYAQCWTDD